MADSFNLSTYTDSGVGSTSSSFANPRYGPDLDTGDLRRKFNFGDRVSELALAQDPFFRFVSKVSKKPTDDPRFKFTERRGSWSKRYAYPVAYSPDGVTYEVDGALTASIANMNAAGDVFYVKMAGDYKTEGNVSNVFNQSNTDVTIGASGTQPNFYLGGQLIKLPIANVDGGPPVDYVIAKVQEVTNVAGSSTMLTQATIEYVKLKLAVVKVATTASGAYFVPRVLATVGTAATHFGIATEYLAGETTIADNAGNGASQALLDSMRSYIVGSSFGEGTGYPETWKDQPFVTGYGQTQIWKTSMAMSNTARATQLRYEPNEWQRIWKEKLIEHKWDIEQSLLFGSQYSDSDGVGHTQGAVDYIINNGNIFSWDTTKNVDDFLDDMSNYLDPRYNNSTATVYFCSTDVFNWFHQLKGYALQNMKADGVTNDPRYTSDLALAGRKKVLGLDTTTVNTVHGDINVVRNIHLDGTNVKILGINMNYCKYRPLAGNGINRDTSVYVGVQTLENSGVDRRVDQILTEAGMEWQMPECHAIWK